MSCPVIKDGRVLDALKIGDRMSDFLGALSCPKAKELVEQWNLLKDQCPHYNNCKNKQCPCGSDCSCLERCGECNCEKKGDAE